MFPRVGVVTVVVVVNLVDGLVTGLGLRGGLVAGGGLVLLVVNKELIVVTVLVVLVSWFEPENT